MIGDGEADEAAVDGNEAADNEPAGAGAGTEPAVPEPTAPVGSGQPAPADGCDGSCAARPRPGTRPAVQAQVRVLIPWQTLAGHSDAPAELEGHGPLPADLARRMAADADSVLQRLLLDPVTGIARHLDLRRYRPPPGLRGFVEDRDQYCHAPGCRRTARTCDLDHVVAYDHTAPDGGAGRTHPDNLRPECRRHHNLTTRGHWHCAPHDEPGEPPAVAWTSPSGHTWIVRSPSLTAPDLSMTDDDRAAGECEVGYAPLFESSEPVQHPDLVEHSGLARC